MTKGVNMRIIDLLNKIANGEEVPKKIRVEGEWTYGIEFEQDDYKHYKNIDDTYDDLFDDLDNIDLDDFLNTEIIDEDKKIKKLEHAKEDDILVNGKSLLDKIDEIIDIVNKLKVDRK